jgi:hypothetical protein
MSFAIKGASGVPQNASPGDVLETYSDGAATMSATTYTKYKEIRLARGGSYRVKFDLKGGNAIVYARVYLNGTAHGTEQSDDTLAYVTKSEDLAGFSTGDLIQVYGHKNAAPDAAGLLKNFRIYSTERVDHEVIT